MMTDKNRYIQVYIHAHACTRKGEAGTPFVAEYVYGHRQGGYVPLGASPFAHSSSVAKRKKNQKRENLLRGLCRLTNLTYAG